MRDLFSEDSLFPEDSINKLSPALAKFAGEMGGISGEEGLLEYICQLLVSKKVASDYDEALSIIEKVFDKIIGEVEQKDLVVSLADLKGESIRLALRKLQDKIRVRMEKPKPVKYFLPLHLFGTLSHEAVLKLLSYKEQITKVDNNYSRMRSNDQQLLLFNSDAIQGTLFETKAYPLDEIFDMKNGGRIKRSWLNELKLSWQRLINEQQGDKWSDVYFCSISGMTELERLLSPIFSEQIGKARLLCDKYGVYANYLYLQSLMSWAAVIIDLYDKYQHFPVFTEIKALDVDCRHSAGQMDALVVKSINDRPPNSSQGRIFQKIRKQKYRSVAWLVKDLVKVYGNQIELEILELKFAVGDAVNNDRIIKPEEIIAAPFKKHLDQVHRYLAESSHDVRLLSDVTDGWLTRDYFTRGEIVYVMPTSLPLIHSVVVDEFGKRVIYQRQVANKWSGAKRTAKQRNVLNEVVSHAINLTNGNGNANEIDCRAKKRGLTNDRLFSSEKNEKSAMMESIIADHLEFLDPDNIIQVIGYKDDDPEKPLYGLHYDKLITAVDAEIVRSNRFNSEKGGFVCCLNPAHPERTPSMYINLNRGTFKCFGGCGIKGRVLKDTVPLDLRQYAFTKKSKRLKRHVETGKLILEVPERHVEVMALVQSLLNEELGRNSAGRDYLGITRRIDPDFAVEKSIGFGSNHLLQDMLDLGISYEEMIYYGFVGFSTRIKPERGVCPILIKNGYKLNELYRKVKYNKEQGLPYFVLDKRITAPLTYPDAKINNFYGRLITPGEAKHRKLTQDFTDILHGVYNMELLSFVMRYLVIVEGIMDALSLMLMGVDNVMPLIGADNEAIFDAIAKSNVEALLICLDNDWDKKLDTGKEKTKKIFKIMPELEFKGRLIDFTKVFLQRNPQFVACDDFNKILQDFGPFPVMDLVEEILST